MLKGAKYFIIMVTIFSTFFILCKSNSNKVIKVNNSSPKYADEEFVKLEKLHSIDVTEISLFGKDTSTDMQRLIDFDDNNNLYILDSFESKISVFNEKGEFVKSFGRAGQGPKEFTRPNELIIKGDKIYVFQGFFECKIMDLEGEYISALRIQIENPLRFMTAGDYFYLFRGKTDNTFTDLEFILLRAEDDNFSSSKEIFRYKYPLGLRGPNYNFWWPNWLLILNSGEFYFPEDNFSKYSIIKYSNEGNPKLIFNRKYNMKEYSKEAIDRFYSMYEKQIKRGDMEFPKSPPVVRKMFQDNKKNVWVISGETYEDNRDPDHENTIDIFSKEGEWLYSFKSKSISRYCFYNNDKIYRVLPINLDAYDQFIEVYKIKY
jgi:hypothetical protein